jgi:hypothetical protein
MPNVSKQFMEFSTLPKSIAQLAMFSDVVSLLKKSTDIDISRVSYGSMDKFFRLLGGKFQANMKRPYIQRDSRLQALYMCAKFDQVTDLASGNATYMFINDVGLYQDFLEKTKVNLKMNIMREFNSYLESWNVEPKMSMLPAYLLYSCINNESDVHLVTALMQPKHYTFCVHYPQHGPTSYAVTISTMDIESAECVKFLQGVYGNRLNNSVPFGSIYVRSLKPRGFVDVDGVVRPAYDSKDAEDEDMVTESLTPLNPQSMEELNKVECCPKNYTFNHIRAAVNLMFYREAFGKYVEPGIPDNALFRNTLGTHLQVHVAPAIQRTGSTKASHFRSGFFRTLRSDFYKAQKGKTLWVNATYVNRCGNVETIHKSRDLRIE